MSLTEKLIALQAKDEFKPSKVLSPLIVSMVLYYLVHLTKFECAVIVALYLIKDEIKELHNVIKK